MKRRSFLTLLATLVSWVSVRPKLHADAVKADPSFAFQGETRAVIRFWDGMCCLGDADAVREYGFSTMVGDLWVPRLGAPGEYLTAVDGRVAGCPGRRTFIDAKDDLGTVFKLGQVSVDELAPRGPLMYRHYEYVSGPKWWDS